MSRLKLAVVGVGHLGKIHARLAATLPEVELVAVVDPVTDACQSLASELGVPGFADPLQIVGLAEAAIVAVPTRFHLSVASQLLKAGLHLLVEKPLAATLAEAESLVEIARQAHRVLQVGHIERFNPALEAARPHLGTPRFIEAVRASGYTFRSTDIGVVHDLMIHDLDVVLDLVQSPVVDVEALGVAVIGPHEDMARARLRFENGCVACLSASRTSFAAQRSMQVYTDTSFAALDFATRTGVIVRPSEKLLRGEIDVETLSPAEKNHYKEHLFSELLPREEIAAPAINALLEEQRDFAASIRDGRAPRVPGEEGRNALAVAEWVLDCIAQHAWHGTADGPIGPRREFLQPQSPPLTGPHWHLSPQRGTPANPANRRVA